MTSVNFDRAASFYDATRGFPPGVAERVRDAIVAATGLGPGGRVLELGIGTGRVALPFLRAGYRYAGVDLARDMLEVLQGKLGPGDTLPLLVQGDVTALPLAAARFDLAIAVHVLHLVADWRATLLEARRVLRPGAPLLLAGSPWRHPRDEPEEMLTPPQRATRAWLHILGELGSSPNHGQPGIRLEAPELEDELRAQGASVERATLVEYSGVPASAREVLRRHRERMFSSDWARPAEVHAEAVARLERWIAEQCDDPDTPFPQPGRFEAMLVRWG
jgi:SAM-dependent methyltransferase